MFASKPRFLDGDPQLRANLTGMKEPDREMDDTYLDFEPVMQGHGWTGTALSNVTFCCCSAHWFYVPCAQTVAGECEITILQEP